jgi:hypothetical protein
MATGRVLLTCAVFGLLVACGSRQGDRQPAGVEANASRPDSATYAVSSVTGPGWLKNLGLTLSQTHMGQMGGTQPIPATPRREPRVRSS